MPVLFFIREVILDIHISEVLDASNVWAAEGVNETNIMSYIEHVYGPPKSVAWTSMDGHEHLEIGWTYEVPEGRDVPGRDVELIVIPMFADENFRDQTSLFAYLADQRRMFEELAAEGHPVSIVTVPPGEWEPDGA